MDYYLFLNKLQFNQQILIEVPYVWFAKTLFEDCKWVSCNYYELKPKLYLWDYSIRCVQIIDILLLINTHTSIFNHQNALI